MKGHGVLSAVLIPKLLHLSRHFVLFYVRSSAAKALLVDMVEKVSDVDRFLHSRKVEEARAFLSFHFNALVFLGSVKKEVAALVFRQINTRYSQLFGKKMTLITPLHEQPSCHPYLLKKFDNAKVCS